MNSRKYMQRETTVVAKSKFMLKKEHNKNTQELAKLNRELAAQMILLASQTGDTEPLKQAVDALRAVDELYTAHTTPREKAEIRQTLADTLLTLGRANDDITALEHSIIAYRDAITLASMLGDQKLRKALKRNYNLAKNLLGNRGTSFKGAA